MKRVIFTLATLAFLGLSMNNALAQGGTTGPLTWNINNGTLTISGSGDMPDYTDPDYAPWYNYRESIKTIVMESGITAIGNCAFLYHENLNSAAIPNSVKTIGDDAFSCCSKLTSITIPNGVTTIGYWAFSFCHHLTSITLPNSVTTILGTAFNDCRRLPSITIPNSVTTIGQGAFSFCAGLTSIDVENGNSAYASEGGVLFDKNKNTLIRCPGGKIGACTIPNSVTTIEWDAFSYCSNLTSIDVASENTTYASDNGVLFDKSKTTLIRCPEGKIGTYTIPNGVTIIGNSAFENCLNLTLITLPEGVVTIKASAFARCGDFTSITLPESLITIERYAFENSNITEITIPANVAFIGDRAFSYGLKSVNFNAINCEFQIVNNGTYYASAFTYSGVTTLNIGSEVSSIPDYAFNHCMQLKDIYTNHSIPLALGENAFGEVDASNCTVHLPSIDDIPAYLAADIWKDFLYGFTSSPIIYGLSLLSTPKFAVVYGLIPEYTGSITIPKTINYGGETINVTAIRDYAFQNCSNLLSVSLPSSVTTITANLVFGGCTKLASIDADNANPNLSSDNGVLFNKNKDTLLYCPEGKSGDYYIPNGVTIIGSNSFLYCDLLTSINISESVTTISARAFSECKHASVNIPKSVTTIGSRGFVRVGGPFNVDSENQNYSSSDGVLFNKNKTRLVCFPVSKAGIYAIPNSVQNILSRAFYGCENLTSLTIPNSVDTIGTQNMFGYCTGLTSVYVQWNIPLNVEFFTFGNLEVENIKLYVPKGTAALYSVADVWADFQIEEYDFQNIQSLSTTAIKIYPNPVSYELQVTSYEGGDANKGACPLVEIYDVMGRRVMTIAHPPLRGGLGGLNVSHLPSGMYFLKIGEKTAKFVKE